MIAARQFRDFLMRQGLVIAKTLQELGETADADIERILLVHPRLLPWPQWAGEFAAVKDFPVVAPPGEWFPCDAMLSALGRELCERHYAILSAVSPVVLVGVLNPFRVNEIESAIAAKLPGRPRLLMMLSPEQYALTLGRLEAGAFAVEPWQEFSAERLLTLLEAEPKVLPLPPNFIESGETIEQVPDCLLLAQTGVHAWVGAATDVTHGLLNRVTELLRREVIFFDLNDAAHHRLRQAANRHEDAPMTDSGKLTAWPDTSGQEPTMIGQVLYDQLIGFAVDNHASDISLEPKKDGVRVRVKINGAYYDQAALDVARYKHLAVRIKLMGGGSMNPDETLTPQDGSAQYTSGKVVVDLRFNTVPALHGEMIGIRLLDARVPGLADLRFSHVEMRELNWFLAQDRGMFISTGSTGSGKTTTLYALLKAHADPARKLITIEDPVEKRFVEATQIPVRNSRGVTFGAALRAILRQDPNVILVGEIRDEETARVALQAALTGHKVLTTIHTNDAVGIFERMHLAWNIAAQPLMEALRLCVGQRLFQKICPRCCKKRQAAVDDLRGFPEVNVPNPIIAEPVGCEHCRNGIVGRIPAIEMVRVDCLFAELVNQGKSPNELRVYNRQRGFPSLAQQAAILVQTGVIPLNEGRLVLAD